MNLRKLKGTKVTPFAEKLEEEIKVTRKREVVGADKKINTLIVQRENGEVIGEQQFVRYRKVDSATYTKLYMNYVKNWWDMPAPATRVFSYIMSHLKPNKGEIYLDLDEVMKYCNYKTDVSVFKGLRWLVQENIVAKGRAIGWWWINVNIIFNGDRVAFLEGLERDRSLDKPKLSNDPNQLPGQTILDI